MSESSRIENIMPFKTYKFVLLFDEMDIDDSAEKQSGEIFVHIEPSQLFNWQVNRKC